MIKKKFDRHRLARSKKGFIKNAYSDSWNYIKDSKAFIFLAIAIFVFTILLGYLFPIFFVDQINSYIHDLVSKTDGLGDVQLIGFIFFNNTFVAFISILSGILLGIIPIINTAVNGYVIGFVINLAISKSGVISLWSLLPHGMFELPAILISLGLGIKIGSFVFRRNKKLTFKYYFLNSLKVFVFVVIPLLIIAAIIEGSLIALFG